MRLQNPMFRRLFLCVDCYPAAKSAASEKLHGMRGQVVRTPGMLMLTAGTAVQAAGLVLFSQQVPPNPKPRN